MGVRIKLLILKGSSSFLHSPHLRHGSKRVQVFWQQIMLLLEWFYCIPIERTLSRPLSQA